MTQKVPIVVVGGGPAGCACALRLSRLGHEVCILTDSQVTDQTFCETSSQSLVRTLMNQDLLLPLECGHPLPFFFSAWGSEELEGRSLAFWQTGNGRVLDRAALDRWLLNEATAAGAEVITACRVVHAKRDGGRWLIQSRVRGKDHSISAQFVIEATGRAARSVFQPDATRLYADHLVCLSVEVSLPSAEEGAIVESTKDGWWYAVPSAGNRSFVAHFTDADRIPPMTNRRSWLAKSLRETRHVRRWIQSIPHDAHVRTGVGRTSIRSVLWRDNWLTVGDSSWTLDPLSGSGVERAIKSGVLGGQALSESILTQSAEPLSTCAIAQVNSFETAMRERRTIYQSEPRFLRSPFWKRRTS